MASSIIDSNYYKDMFGTSQMRSIFSDDARLQAWIDTGTDDQLNLIFFGYLQYLFLV